MGHFEQTKSFLGQTHKFYIDGQKEIIEYLEQESSTENKIEYLKEGIKKLIEFGIKNELELRKNVPIDKRMSDIDVSGEAIKELKSFCENLLEKHIELKDTEKLVIRNSKNKLNWNGQNNSLYFLFSQLKKINGKNNKPILNATNKDIALFLKENFDCFESTSIETIVSQLKPSSTQKKGVNKIEIWI